jgi:hypothetical protein
MTEVMTETEITNLLKEAQRVDGRTIGKGDIESWMGYLDGYTFEECQAAIREHYRNTTDWMKPAHIHALIKGSQQARIAAYSQAVPALPANPSERPRDWRSALSEEAGRAVQANEARRAAVLAHPDLAAKLCEPPLALKRPEQWRGFVPPKYVLDERGVSQINTSPIRAQLLPIVTEAHARSSKPDARKESA